MEERVRISIAFIDWAHEHEGTGEFTRKSLTDRCSLCADGHGEKVYKAGHLVHLALTRIPAYPTATIDLEEKSMSDSKRHKDAASIVGKYADELEEEDKLVGRSADNIDPAAVVVKREDVEDYEDDDEAKKKKKSSDEEEAPAEESEESSEEESEEMDEEEEKGDPPFGGAKSLADAEDFIARNAGDKPVLMDSMNVLASVLTNIAGTEHGPAIHDVIGDFQTRLDAEVLRTLSDVRRSLPKEATMPEDSALEPKAAVAEAEAAPDAADAEALPEAEVQEGDEVNLAVASLLAAYQEASETPAEEAVRLRMIQEPFEKVAEVIKANIGGDAPKSEEAPALEGGVTLEAISQAVAAQVAPLAAEIESLKSASAASGPVSDGLPVRRAVTSGSLFQANSLASD
jgi:hypothetical protein